MTSVDTFKPKVPPRDSSVWKTPMFEQYWNIRQAVRPGTLLFYRMGDFYELFGEDAVVAAPVLEIQLTARQKDADIPIPMCGIPAHSWESYGEKLLKRGQKIALCEQTTPPDSGKLVERKVIRVLTPGLPVDFKHLDAKESHWLMAVVYSEPLKTYELCVCDLLAGSLHQGTLREKDQVLALYKALRPKEILVQASQLNLWHSLWPSSLITLWDDSDSVASLFWSYLEYTQCKAKSFLETLFPFRGNLEELQSHRSGQFAALSPQVASQWDVDPHLFGLLDDCGSAMGSRALRKLLLKPLAQPKRIQTRQKTFAYLSSRAKVFLNHSKDVYDLERVMGRFRLEVVKPRELIRLSVSLKAMLASLDSIDWNESFWKEFCRDEGLSVWQTSKSVLEALVQKLSLALDLDVDLMRSKNTSDLFRSEYDQTLHELRNISQNSESWLKRFEEKLRSDLSISSLKVRYNRIFGFYIEVTNAHADKMPAHFERRQTMANAQRFSCEELKNEEQKILSASTKLEDRAAFLVEELTKEILSFDETLQSISRLFSIVDAFCGAASMIQKLKRFGPWNFPEVCSGPFFFDYKNGRHPLVEAIANPGAFVSNSLKLDQAQRVIVLTGPNMAGKSTLMRQCGLLVLLAQVGFPVSADAMSLAPCDGFYSRMGASDKILEGESTFMVEMKETAEILTQATSQSLVLVDEIGRGTSTQDGLSIAQSVLEHIHNELGACTIFATHYHELSDLVQNLTKAKNYSMQIREWKGELVFLRKLVEQPAASSHGIYVAELAGLPVPVLSRSRELFDGAPSEVGQALMRSSAKKLLANLKDSSSHHQLSMFPDAPREIEVPPKWALQVQSELKNLNLEEMSPRQSWDFLDRLKSQIPDPT